MIKSILLTLFLINSSFLFVSAQDEQEKKVIEIEVRKLDSLHAAAVLGGDLNEMDKYWTEDFMVTNPFNEIDKADRIRNGTVTYASFQRICEAVQIHENVAILMGKEIVVPKGKSPDSGKIIIRRYTNIWMKINGLWKLVARHASVICS
ncbi:MAG TPA: nuclear transport factor 2 family protein [Bacteroidales bacterium]|nr:nuclear transport factor 2 family protein [Bacteroidales bacterium]